MTKSFDWIIVGLFAISFTIVGLAAVGVGVLFERLTKVL